MRTRRRADHPAEAPITVFRPGAPSGVRWAYLAVTVVGVAVVVWVARQALLPLGLAGMTAYLLAPLVAWLEHRRIHRVVAIFFGYALTALVITGMGVYLVPLIVQQSAALARALPRWMTTAQSTWDRYLVAIHQAPLPLGLRGALNHVVAQIDGVLLKTVSTTLTAAVSLLPWLLAALVAPVLAFYLLKDLRVIQRRLWQLVPLDWQPAVYKLGRDLDSAMAGYIRGQLLVALLVGVLAGLWTLVLGIRFPVLVGAIAGLTDVVPYVGPVMGALPAVWLGLMHSPSTALYAVLGFVAIHQLEGTVISPQVVGDAVGLHPLMVVVAVLAGAEWAGLFGMLVAVPVVAAVRIVGQHLYHRLAAGDRGW